MAATLWDFRDINGICRNCSQIKLRPVLLSDLPELHAGGCKALQGGAGSNVSKRVRDEIRLSNNFELSQLPSQVDIKSVRAQRSMLKSRKKKARPEMTPLQLMAGDALPDPDTLATCKKQRLQELCNLLNLSSQAKTKKALAERILEAWKTGSRPPHSTGQNTGAESSLPTTANSVNSSSTSSVPPSSTTSTVTSLPVASDSSSTSSVQPNSATSAATSVQFQSLRSSHLPPLICRFLVGALLPLAFAALAVCVMLYKTLVNCII